MSSINFDSSDFNDKIDRISKFENLEKIEKKMLRSGLSIIRKATKQELKRKLPNATKRSKMYDDTLAEGVLQSVFNEGKDMLGKVHVMGTRRSTSGTYRLRFFEGGTEERIIEKTGRAVGRIKPLYFFETARNSSEDLALRKIEDEWNEQIEILLR